MKLTNTIQKNKPRQTKTTEESYTFITGLNSSLVSVYYLVSL